LTSRDASNVSGDTEFKWVTSQIDAHRELRDSTFRIYVQTFSAIVAGTIWLSVQRRYSTGALLAQENHRFAALTVGAACLLALVSAVMLWESLRGWRSYRTAQHSLARHVPLPKWWPLSIAWVMMIVAVLGGTCLFWWFNPFGRVTSIFP
jgi:hypothetical protein